MMISAIIFSLDNMLFYGNVLPPVCYSQYYSRSRHDLLIVPQLTHARQGGLSFDYSVQVCCCS